MLIKIVRNRQGDMVEFDEIRIQKAIEKAFFATGESFEEISDIVECVIEHLDNMHRGENIVGLEHIQDIVEKCLMQKGKYEVAKQYIIYRNKRAEERQQEEKEKEQLLSHNTLNVTKKDGSKQPFDINKVKNTYLKIVGTLEAKCPFEEISANLTRYICDEVKTDDINKLLVKSCIDLISTNNIDRQFLAGRFLCIDLYKRSSKARSMPIDSLYSPTSFKDLVVEYVRMGLYYQDFLHYYQDTDLIKAGEHIVGSRDFEYGYTTVLMLKKRYLLNQNGIIKELPQHMYMAVALFLAIPEKAEQRLDIALKIYDIISTQKLSLATPTLMNARRRFHQLSSCFKLSVNDDLRAIYHSIENVAQISKFGGGVGVYLGHIRSKGASIRGFKGVSGGIMPWIKVINDTAIAVNQLGARAGAVSVTTDIRHKDIHDFLDLQTETGDIRRKSFDIFPAVSIPDLFLKRVEADSNWTLFDPKEVADVTGKRLEDLYGTEFELAYEELEKNTKLEFKEEVSAKNLFKTFLKVVVETGMPYVFFRDTVNKANPNKHAGMVYSSQLCTEIAQNTSDSTFVEEVLEDGNISIKYKPGDTVVCNLASINVAMVNTREQMQEVIPLAMRVLDNVIDLNYFPIKESEITAKKYRSIGLGFLGFAEYLATNGMMYDSKEAIERSDKLFEEYAYYTLKTSKDLAIERGKYSLFEGSDWSKGILMGKDKAWFGQNSKTDLNRSGLIDDIQSNGLRFSYHLSPAPNTSTAQVVGTTAGLLPIYKKYYVYTDAVAPAVNVAPKLDKSNFWLYKEYTHMKMPEVIDMISTIQKRIDQAISFEWIINPADTSPKDLYEYYIKARKQGIKTVYYVRSMTLDVKECVSCSG